MTERCEELKERLADHGLEGLDDDKAAHLARCEDCSGFWALLQRVDAELDALPGLSPSEALVQATLSGVKARGPVIVTRAPSRRWRWAAGLSAAASVALMVIGVTVVPMARLDEQEPGVKGYTLHKQERLSYYGSSEDEEGQGGRGFARELPPANQPAPGVQMPKLEGKEALGEDRPALSIDVLKRGYVSQEPSILVERPKSEPQGKKPPTSGLRQRELLEETQVVLETEKDKKTVDRAEGRLSAKDLKKVLEPEEPDLVLEASEAFNTLNGAKTAEVTRAPESIEEGEADEVEEEHEPQDEDGDPIQDLKDDGLIASKLDASRFAGLDRPRARRPAFSPPPPPARRDAAARFLAARDDAKGHRFQEASGYWRNSYVPGDPALRRLLASLEGEQVPPALSTLSQQAQLYTQPLDPPHSAALSLSLMADKQAVEGPRRALVQLALKATDIHGRRRPAMNLALVLYLPGDLDLESQRRLTALVKSFAKQKQLGDAFSITVAGRPGGLILSPKDFDYGHVAVALNALLQAPSAERPGRAWSLQEATERAYALISPDDKAPLGASALVLITAAPLGPELPLIAQRAHKQALQGNLTSLIAVSEQVPAEQLSRIALAGQGQQQQLLDPQLAERAAERTLSAVSRTVARAVRLRIRLMAGVRLIDVLGSERLDLQQAERVRQMERSIDQRLSRTMGIQADRGEDEDGIQIVIPSFYAGDTHVILLDVVVQGPGPVAEVSIKYKDLAFLKNGAAQAHLSFAKGEAKRGPLQQAVLKNLVAHELARTLTTASAQLARGDREGSTGTLSAGLALLEGLMFEVPGWSQDQDLERDRGLLRAYMEASRGPAELVSRSMEVAAKLKLQHRP